MSDLQRVIVIVKRLPMTADPASTLMRAFAVSAVLALAACASSQPARVTKANALDLTSFSALPQMKTFTTQAASAPIRSNSDIAADFMDLEFSLESGRALPVFTRFDGPMTVALAGDAPQTATADLGQLLTRLRNEAGLEISSKNNASASIIIEFLPRKQMQAVVPTAACFVAPRVRSWADYRKNRNSARLDWTTLKRRDHLAIFIPSDTSPQEVRDCLHEELAQAIGPLNDLYRLPDSVFNDDNFHAVLTGFDMLVLRLHNSPELKNGMTPKDVAARLPALLSKLNPDGEFTAERIYETNSRSWIVAIETALGPGIPAKKREKAAELALKIARNEGWSDNRLAFSYFAYGRLNLGKDVPRAVAAFSQASKIYRTLPDGPIHVAHVDMQVAALALSSGQPEVTIALADTAIPVAMRAQNAALLATFLLLKAQALDQLGSVDKAQAARLDSLSWARYGFGADSEVHARMADIAALSPIGIGG